MRFPFKLTPRITLLGTEFFNLYLVQGETCAIVDGGVSGMTYPFLSQLGQLDIPLEGIHYLVITHSHFDHMMIFPFLKERCPWMKIVSSELNQKTFSNQRITAKIFDSDRKMTLTLLERGLISEAPSLPPYTSFPLNVPVREGSILDLGKGIRIRFIETPGHAPDGLCVYDEKEGVLFCSDAAGFYAPPDFFRPNYWFNLKEADRSFYKMRGLDPGILCRGHYGVISGRETVRRHLLMAHQSIEDFKNFVLDRIQGGGSIEQMAQEVTDRFSRGLLELFPAEDNLRLWRLLVRRTLEHLGIEMEEGS